jgi:hypothetical protein
MGNKKKKVAPMTKDEPGVEGPRQAASSRTQQKAQVALVNPCRREPQPLMADPDRFSSFIFKNKVRALLFILNSYKCVSD